MPELLILVGLQGAGKSSFFRSLFAPTHAHVSKDLIPNIRDKNRRQSQLIEAAFEQGQNVVVDNTSLTRAIRAPLIAQGKASRARVYAFVFEADLNACLARNATRQGRARVPDWVIGRALQELEYPALDEGFDEIFFVRLRDGIFQIAPHPFDETP